VRFKTDENLPIDAATTLRACGHDVETVLDETLSGADDRVLADRVRSEERILVTLDLDFANIRAYPPNEHPGIIVLRPKTQDRATIVEFVRKVVAALDHRSPTGALWIVERDRIRYRQDV